MKGTLRVVFEQEDDFRTSTLSHVIKALRYSSLLLTSGGGSSNEIGMRRDKVKPVNGIEKSYT